MVRENFARLSTSMDASTESRSMATACFSVRQSIQSTIPRSRSAGELASMARARRRSGRCGFIYAATDTSARIERNLSPMLSRQGHRLLQVGIALLIFSSIEGFAIPYLPSPPLGLSVHRLSALQAVLLMAL